jgi:hypothetical protein
VPGQATTLTPDVVTPIELNAYPNPASRELHIELKASGLEGAWFTLTDASGQTAYQHWDASTGSAVRQLTLKLPALPAGAYFLTARLGKSQASKTISIRP